MMGDGYRRVLRATCTTCGDATGFTNLAVTKLVGGGVQLDPHAVGACVIKLSDAEGRALGRVLRDWLG
ncbi:MAG: hypothetical protein ACRDSF_25080 [Pseudonocardiaceae bacterium]